MQQRLDHTYLHTNPNKITHFFFSATSAILTFKELLFKEKRECFSFTFLQIARVRKHDLF